MSVGKIFGFCGSIPSKKVEVSATDEKKPKPKMVVSSAIYAKYAIPDIPENYVRPDIHFHKYAIPQDFNNPQIEDKIDFKDESDYLL